MYQSPFERQFVKIKKINLFYPLLFSNTLATIDGSFQFNECCLNCFVSAIVEVYKNEGNEVCLKGDFLNASHFYTEGIKVKCGNKELKAKLYNDRATVHFKLGENLAHVFQHSFCFFTWQSAPLEVVHEHTSVSRRCPRNFSQFPLFFPPPIPIIISRLNISTVS